MIRSHDTRPLPAAGPARLARAALPFAKGFAYFLVAAAALGLGGCLTDDKEEDGGPGPAAGTRGLETLRGAASAVFMDGRLYVGNRADTALGIAVIDPDADTLLAFHAETLPPNSLAASGDSVLVISESDYSVGALSRLNGKTGAFDASYKAVSSDNALSADGDRVFLLDRKLGVVTGFTGGTLADANVFFNLNTGTGSNPHEVALSGETAFITRYNSAFLLVAEADKKNGGTLDSIDLSEFVADTLRGVDGALPRMDGAAVYGDRLFVTVQRLGKGYEALDTSLVVVIDVDSREVVGTIKLRHRNPVANSTRGKYLYVACVGKYGAADGAVERIDMETAGHAGIVVTESDLIPESAGEEFLPDLSDFVAISDTKGYVLFAPDFETNLIRPVTLP